MRVATKVVIDIASMVVIAWEGYEYDGPVETCTQKKRSPYIGAASTISQQQQKAGQGNIDTGVGLEKGAVTDPTSSPLYKAIYSTEAGQMSKAYDTAAANTASRAKQAGFGYEQPAAQGAQNELRAQQASSIGQLPGEVARETVPMELQAGRDIAGAGEGELRAGNEMFTGGVVPLEKQYQDYALNYTPLWQRALQGGVRGGLNAAMAGV